MLVCALGVVLGRRAANTHSAPELLIFVPAAAGLLGGVFVHDYQMLAAVPAALTLACKTEGRVRTAAWAALMLLVPTWTQSGSTMLLGMNFIAIFAAVIITRRNGIPIPKALPQAALTAFAVILVLSACTIIKGRNLPQPRHSRPLPIRFLPWHGKNFSRIRRIAITKRPRTLVEKSLTWIGLVLLLIAAGQKAPTREIKDVRQFSEKGNIEKEKGLVSSEAFSSIMSRPARLLAPEAARFPGSY